MPAMADGI